MKANKDLKRLIKFQTACAIVLLLSFGFPCCTPIDVDIPEDGFMGLQPPRQTAMGEKDNEVTWSCIEFGSYPANEVVDGSFDAVDAYAVREGDVIRDATLYKKLSEAVWTGSETEIDGHRYFRINGEGAVSAAGDREQHYRWNDTGAWHYFEFAPMKWRVLELTGSQALLIADRMPDVCPFHDFGTSSGPTTYDRVFILSENEIFASDAAESYGFYPGDEVNDKATRKRTLSDGTKSRFGETLIRNEVKVLLTRGVKGLYIYACDPVLRQALKDIAGI